MDEYNHRYVAALLIDTLPKPSAIRLPIFHNPLLLTWIFVQQTVVC